MTVDDGILHSHTPYIGSVDDFDEPDNSLLCGADLNKPEVSMDYPDLDKYFTDVEIKAKFFPVFSKLLENQFMHGGSKYRAKNNKEFTDILCEAFPGRTGVEGVLWTMAKYLGRYNNYGREKDLLKVATYAFILWLKGGFYLKKDHDQDIKK